MIKKQFSRSDRRTLLVLVGVMALSSIIIEFREPKEPFKTYKSLNRDSLALLHKIDSAKRAARYLAVKDSYSLLKRQREQRKLAREMAYQAMMDSFAVINANRKKEKEERIAKWNQKLDSLHAVKPQKLSFGETIDLNHSDTLQLQRIPGIGSGFSRTIVRYRQKLGGFYDTTQLLEIDGLPPSILDYVHISDYPQRNILINKNTLNQLRSHPYINYYQAKAIIEYRKKYGNIKEIHQLSLVDAFTEQDLERLSFYVFY